MRRCGLVVGVAMAVGSVSLAADWPQFTGPDRNAVSPETGLVKTFPAEGPKVRWTVKLGEGFGGPAIRDGQVFVLDRVGLDQEAKDVLRCLDLASGKELWTYEYAAPGKTGFNGSRAVPAVSEKYVISVGPFGQLKCLDRTTHNLVWGKSIVQGAVKTPTWAYAQNVLLYKDTAIVGTQGPVGLTAFDQATGNVLWECKDVPSAPYSSPALAVIDGKPQVLFAHGKGVVAADPDTGKRLWAYDGWSCNIPIPSPLSLGDGRVFITGGYKAGSAMIRVDGDKVTELWKIPQGSQIHQPIVVDGCIYFNGNTNEVQDGMVCVNPADGKILWQTKEKKPSKPASGPASAPAPAPVPAAQGSEPMAPKLDKDGFILADGRLWVLDASAALDIVQPSREGFKLISSAPLLSGKQIWAPMALSNGMLVLRDQGQMKCVVVK
jgi:outer membrane protein assembly factor BamB